MPRDIYGNTLPTVEESRDSDIFHNIITNKDYVFDNGEWNELPQDPSGSSDLPTPEAGDAGKAVVVGEDLSYTLGQASGGSGYEVTKNYLVAPTEMTLEYEEGNGSTAYWTSNPFTFSEVGEIITVEIDGVTITMTVDDIDETYGDAQTDDYNYELGYYYDEDHDNQWVGFIADHGAGITFTTTVSAYTKEIEVSDDFKTAVEKTGVGNNNRQQVYDLQEIFWELVDTAAVGTVINPNLDVVKEILDSSDKPPFITWYMRVPLVQEEFTFTAFYNSSSEGSATYRFYMGEDRSTAADVYLIFEKVDGEYHVIISFPSDFYSMLEGSESEAYYNKSGDFEVRYIYKSSPNAGYYPVEPSVSPRNIEQVFRHGYRVWCSVMSNTLNKGECVFGGFCITNSQKYYTVLPSVVVSRFNLDLDSVLNANDLLVLPEQGQS